MVTIQRPGQEEYMGRLMESMGHMFPSIPPQLAYRWADMLSSITSLLANLPTEQAEKAIDALEVTYQDILSDT